MKKIIKTIPFTSEKYKEMQLKVADLEKLREEVMGRLVVARGMGDLSENGAYKYAKFELGNIGRQLKRFKNLVNKGFVAPKNVGKKGLVDFGSSVTIEKLSFEKDTVGAKIMSEKANKTKKQKSFIIVSKHESDPTNGKLAYSSPMGRAVMRKKVGDKVAVETPVGNSEWVVMKVE